MILRATAWLYAVAYRYGVASVADMDYSEIKFWHRGHEILLQAEHDAAERARAGTGK